MRETIRKILLFTKALGEDDRVCIFHPVGLLLYIITLPFIIILCIFTDNNIIYYSKNQYKLTF